MGKEKVVHPAHYNAGKFETIEVIKDVVESYDSFAIGNVIKYVSRYKNKNGIEDLKKARFYLNDLIETLESEGK